MNREKWKNLKYPVLTSILLFLTSCIGEKLPISDAQLVSDMRKLDAHMSGGLQDIGGNWHFDFHTVRAYRMNWESETSWEPIIAAGKLNPTATPTKGVKLSLDQVERLKDAITGSHPDRGIGACFYPHHAFLFFDDKGEIVGNASICLLCNSFRSSPTGYAANWDLAAVAELLHELDIPLQNPNWEGAVRR